MRWLETIGVLGVLGGLVFVYDRVPSQRDGGSCHTGRVDPDGFLNDYLVFRAFRDWWERNKAESVSVYQPALSNTWTTGSSGLGR